MKSSRSRRRPADDPGCRDRGVFPESPGFEATASRSLLEGMVPARGSRTRTMPAEASGSRPFANEEWPCHMEVGASRRYWLAIVLASWAACAAARADELSPAPAAVAGDRLNA